MTDQALRRGTAPVVGAHESPQLERLRRLARLLDSAVGLPGTRYRIGLDPIIGLVPGIGDVIGAIFSIYIIYQAARLGAPRSILVRMLANVGVDTLVGEIPLLGDLFDFGWKSNARNIALLEGHLERPVAAKAASRRVLFLLGLGLLILFAGVIALGVVLGHFLLGSVK
jgi:Domain of unknown function (DUF4112)